jgi:hypothetical protein
MNDRVDVRRDIIALCEAALAGRLEITELHERWPVSAAQDALIEAVYDDLEDAVEHFPAELLSGKLDSTAWRESRARRRLLIGARLIASRSDPRLLLEMRSALIDMELRSDEHIEQEIARRLAALSG